MRTHYDNLHVSEKASPEVIKGAYKALSQKWHPDKHPDQRERAERYFKIIGKAFEVLSDPKARAAYDAWLTEQRNPAEPAPEVKQAKEPPTQSQQKIRLDGTKDQETFLWCRFLARFIDTGLSVLIALLCMIILEYISAKFHRADNITKLFDNAIVVFIIILAGILTIETTLTQKLGTTFGKSLLGIRVTDSEGRNLTTEKSFERALWANLFGQGASIPGIAFAANLINYFLFKRNGITPWDSRTGAHVSRKTISPLRGAACAAVTITILIIFALLNEYSKGVDEHGEAQSPKAAAQQQPSAPSTISSAHKPTLSAEDIHYQKIYAAHPDADAVFDGPAFKSWLSETSDRQRIIDSGTTDEIINLFSAYKARQTTQRTTPAPAATHPRNPYPDCVIRQTMTDADYAACGITPPGR